ncbi:MAG: type II secretion system protein [Firmicutes bacterium]|nr:type II secretion system protein [Bacillota bacterium]
MKKIKIKKHGFTLVELIGVVAILAIILLVSLPAISGMLKNSGEQKYQQTLKDLYLATEQYVWNFREYYPQLERVGGEATVSLQTLRKAGYVKERLENPKTGKYFLNTDYILVRVKGDRTREYIFNGGDGQVPDVDIMTPTFTVSPAADVWSREKTVTIKYQDNKQPNFVYEYSKDGGVTWEVTYNTKVVLNFTATGSVIARVRDLYNNKDTVTSRVFAVSKIDRVSPTCATTGGSTTWTNGNRTLTGTCTDTGGAGCKGNVTRAFTSNTNGSYSPGTVYDNAGNSAVCPSTTVRIDKTKPTCSTSGGSTTWTNGNRTLTGTCADTGGSGCRGNVTRAFTSNTNGSYSPGTVYDNAGNSVSCPSTTVRIDKTAPTCSTTGGSTSWTNGNRTLTGACTDTGGSGCRGNVTRSFTSNTNGSYSPGTVYDNAGNSVSCSATTVRIDKTPPGTVSYKDPWGTVTGTATRNIPYTSSYCGNGFNDTVKVSGDSGGSGVTYYFTYSSSSPWNNGSQYGKTAFNGTTLPNLFAGSAGNKPGYGYIGSSRGTLTLWAQDGAGNKSNTVKVTHNWCTK